MRLDGEIAIVTGASRGLGAEIARALAGAGAVVAVTARRLADAEIVADGIKAAGGNAIAVPCDVADARSVLEAVAAVRSELGAPTILVNNAGVIEPLGPLHKADVDALTTNIEINLLGPARMAQAVLSDMESAGRGTIINVSSGAARRAIAGWGAYCVAKAGLAMLGRVFAAEHGEAGVRVYGFAPGVVDTGMQADIRAAGVGPTATLTPADLAHPREPAAAVAFLCTPAAAPFAGDEVDIRDPAFRQAAGLDPLPT
ncbi:MAG: SDR family oxidoreductase [Hyphomicrobiales bacterium]|nr:SDR family oxidoreductase [Hyphomicrobiales bacterium]